MGNIGYKKSIGLQNIQSYLDFAFIKNGKKLPIISVGSGDAQVEYQFIRKHYCPIICVDPKPDEFTQGRIYVEPEYDYVSNLIKDKPELVGNCHLLLIWPYPNESTYDVEAIKALDPVSFILIYESTGSSGGTQLLEEYLPTQEDYILQKEYIVFYKSTNDHFCNTIAYFTKKGYTIVDDNSVYTGEITF